MARFALLLPREEMVEPAGRIARELEMDVVLNQSVPTERILDLMEDCRRTGADILVARGRQASILKEHTDFPVVEIQLTGLEIARLLHRARSLVSHLERPKIGVVTIPNMVGNIQGFEEIFDIELHTYFISGLSEMERGAEQAVADGMDVILGGDFVNAYCRRLGKRTLFFDGTEDSLRTSLLHARNVGQVADAERRNTAHLQVLLDYSFNGILELDARGIIVQSNDVACKILEQEREKLVGLPLSTLMPREDAEFWADALAQRRELYFSVLNVAGVHVVANAAPVADWDAGEGMVFSFYEMQKMERQGERALRERYRLQRYLAHGRFEDVNHTSREMSRLVKLARTFAETGQPILVYGEVGSGKSLFAQSIHNASPCSKGPFVTFDCAAHSPEQEAALSRGQMLRGLWIGMLGVLVAMMNQFSVNNEYRMVPEFLESQMQSGFQLFPVLIGLFAVSEMLQQCETGMHASYSKDDTLEVKNNVKFSLLHDFKGQIINVFRSALLGTFMGILPGVGGSAASLIAYSQAKSWSKHPELLGTGVPEGLIASETSNNGLTGGALVPLLSLGIPGDSTTAVLIGAFMLQGIQVGPLFITNNPVIWNTILVALLCCNILMYLVMFFPVKLLAKIVLIPQERLYPVVLMMCTVGAYATLNGRMFDVWCLLLFGIVGLLIKKFHFPVSCFLIGFILGGDLEDYFIQVLTAYNGSLTGLFVRPMGWVIWALIILSVVYAVLDNRKAKRQEKELSGKQ